jgi:antitoxin component YwqK of YwqJK toxin-antitoxin module
MKKLTLLFLCSVLCLCNGIGQTKIYLSFPENRDPKRNYEFVNDSDTAYLEFQFNEDMGVRYMHRYSFRANAPDGEYWVYVNKKLELKAFLKDGKKDSTWTRYWPTGKVLRTDPYVTGKLNGKVKEYGSDYNSILPYKTDTLNGLFESWYPNGKLRSECAFTMGVQFVRQLYHDNGQLKERTFYLGESMRRELFGRDGRLEGLEGYMANETFKNGLLNGTKYLWSGEYYFKVLYKHNQLADWEVYHKSGELIAKKDGRGQKVFGKIVRN